MFLILAFFGKKMSTYDMFQKYAKFEYLTFEELKQCVDYICGCLNSWTPNYHY